MFEKRLKAISARAFIADGNEYGQITISDTRPFKVKQEIIISANALPNLELEVKKVLSDTILIVGPRNSNINQFTDISSYTVSASANIFANEQKRPSIPFEEHERANYEEEPTVADRVILVDELGEFYDDDNPLPVDATVNLTGSKPGNPTIFNKLVLSANVEESVIIPAYTEKITISVRSNRAIRLQYAWNAGESATKFITVWPGSSRVIDGIGLTIATPLYFQLSLTELSGTIVEIETWNT